MMKKIILLPIFSLVTLLAFSQLDVSFEKDTITVERDKTVGQIIPILVNIKNTNPFGGAVNTINFLVNPAGTTLPASDYIFTNPSLPVAVGTRQVECPVTILRGENASNDTLFISVQMSYNNPLAQVKNTVLKIINKSTTDEKGGEKTGVNAVQDDKIMYLNAYNFEFGGTSLSSNYVGHLNLFSPSLNKRQKKNDKLMLHRRYGFGFNTGIMKINYGQANNTDSTSSNNYQRRENVFVSPFDTLKEGLQYLRQINNYKSVRQNTVWSLYSQPLFELTYGDGKQHIYLHGHLELLASNWSYTTTVTNIKQDTAIFTPPAANGFVIRSNITGDQQYNTRSLSGYFGGGLTFDLRPWDGGSFFFQPTVGVTSNENPFEKLQEKLESKRTWRGFYLFRSYYTHVVSKNSTVVVGVDIRGFLPFYDPQYSAYIGLNLKLGSILGLIGGKE